MNKTLLASLNDAERLLVAETETAAMAGLDEDAVAALHDRVRRARNKYVGQYRRGASTKVAKHAGRGVARPKNQTAALKAEAFEEALSRVSRRLAALARASAAELKAERLEAARGSKSVGSPTRAVPAAGAKKGRSVTAAPRGDRALRSPAREKNRATTKASGARRQAKRDSR
jgi:hypothetical protein